MDRRSFIMSAGAGAGALAGAGFALERAAAAVAPAAGASATDILIGQSAVLTGPLSAGALVLQAGIQLALDEANAQGGIAGRQLRLAALDDGFDPVRAHANYQALVQQQVLACVGGVGPACTLAGLPVLREAGVPLVAATGVVDSARDKTQGVAYYTRASQQRECEGLVQHLHAIGIQRISVAHFSTPGGQEVLGQLQAVIARLGLRFQGAVALAPDGSNAEAAGKALAQQQAQAAILFLSGAPAAGLIKSVWDNGGAPAFYGMSVLSGEAIAKVLGTQTRGVAIAEVTPYPWDGANADAVQYRRLAERAKVPVGYHSYEGYLGTRVLIAALKRVGRDLTRAKLHASLGSLRTRIAGLDIDFSGGRHTGSTFVELVRVRSDGKFVR